MNIVELVVKRIQESVERVEHCGMVFSGDATVRSLLKYCSCDELNKTCALLGLSLCHNELEGLMQIQPSLSIYRQLIVVRDGSRSPTVPVLGTLRCEDFWGLLINHSSWVNINLGQMREIVFKNKIESEKNKQQKEKKTMANERVQ